MHVMYFMQAMFFIVGYVFGIPHITPRSQLKVGHEFQGRIISLYPIIDKGHIFDAGHIFHKIYVFLTLHVGHMLIMDCK